MSCHRIRPRRRTTSHPGANAQPDENAEGLLPSALS
jgi:hypothetical protein